MKRVLITGASGFIGYHLASHLKKRNDFVIGIDNFNDYYDQNLKTHRSNLLKEIGIDIHVVDVLETDKIIKIINDNSITHIVHLAAQAGVRKSFTHPEDYITNNINGFYSVLEVCKKFPSIVLLYASSSSVYGLNRKSPFSEDDYTDQPANLYGATKKSNEAMAFAYHNLYKTKMTGLRYFTVYGPLGRPDMAYFSFAQSIKQDKPISVFNHGKMRRDFTYIDDIVDGTVAALDLESSFEVFNLGNNRPIGIMHLIEELEKGLSKKAIIDMLPMQPGELVETCADISKSNKLLNYQPKVGFEDGMSKFIDWFSSYQSCALSL